MKKKPSGFKITGESGISIISEDFFDGPAPPDLTKPHLTGMFLESIDYHNGYNLTFQFSRGNRLKLRDGMEFAKKEPGEEIITKLRDLADRLEKNL